MDSVICCVSEGCGGEIPTRGCEDGMEIPRSQDFPREELRYWFLALHVDVLYGEQSHYCVLLRYYFETSDLDALSPRRPPGRLDQDAFRRAEGCENFSFVGMYVVRMLVVLCFYFNFGIAVTV